MGALCFGGVEVKLARQGKSLVMRKYRPMSGEVMRRTVLPAAALKSPVYREKVCNQCIQWSLVSLIDKPTINRQGEAFVAEVCNFISQAKSDRIWVLRTVASWVHPSRKQQINKTKV